MNFLSTKEISMRWGITPRRITMLASQGRIEGAKQIDGRWFIPEDAARPSDPRKKTVTPQSDADDRYIFPLPLSIVKSEEQINGFTPEEKALYRLCLLFEEGNFPEARVLAERLLSSSNHYIRLGALYFLPPICMYLLDFGATEDYFIRFHAACEDTKMHKAEIDLLLIELDGELVSSYQYAKAVDFSNMDDYPDELMPVIGAYKLFSDITMFETNGDHVDIQTYEILCRMSESQGQFYCALVLHLYLYIYFALAGDETSEYRHMEKALEIGLEHGTLFTLSGMMSYSPETANDILSQYPSAIRLHIENLSDKYKLAKSAYAKYQGKMDLLSQLNKDDYRLISYCIRKHSIEEMGERFGLTRSGINKRLAILYKKLGVKSKKELINMYIHSLID